MKKSILITGIPGSGKTAISDKLREMGHKAYDLDGVNGLCRLINRKTGETIHKNNSYNIEKIKTSDWVCDVRELKIIMENASNELTFYCGVYANIDEMIPLFDRLILLKVS